MTETQEKKIIETSQQQDPITVGLAMLMRASTKGKLGPSAYAVSNLIKVLNDGIGRVWGMCINNGQNIVQISTMFEASRLSNQLLARVLVEKELITEEELIKRQKEEVEDVLIKMQEKAQERAEEAQKEIEEKLEETQEKIKETTKKTEEVIETAEKAKEEIKEESDVILASEKSNVVKFPTKDD